MGRAIAVLGVLAWLGVLALFAVAIRWGERPREVAPVKRPSALVRELNGGRLTPDDGISEWIVTGATSAHRALVVDVAAERVEDAMTIARQIVTPVLDREYEEILVYVWMAGAGREGADRRVQWTPKGGYHELIIAE
jgi:hypothetical protein